MTIMRKEEILEVLEQHPEIIKEVSPEIMGETSIIFREKATGKVVAEVHVCCDEEDMWINEAEIGKYV